MQGMKAGALFGTALAGILASSVPAWAQTAGSPTDEARVKGAGTSAGGAAPTAADIFAPLAYPQPENVYRAGSGLPGPAYWQNRADYSIAARIDPATHVLSGSETITYTNNSPDTLDVLWIQLDQNIYRPDSRAASAAHESHGSHPGMTSVHTDGVVIEHAAVDGAAVTPLVSDTRMQIRLARPLPPRGRVAVRISWHYTVPGTWGGRTAVSDTKNGPIYEIAQWYPRMEVYDDRRGWNTLPYLGQEFFLDYGDFDYSVEVPWNYTVAGSGALTNPNDVLTAAERARLAQAGRSETRVMIRTPANVTDPHSHAASSGTKTWHFHMANTRDVSFAASPAFVWDAAHIDLPDESPGPGRPKQPRLAMSVYPVEGIGAHGWDRSTTYVKHAIEYFSSMWFVYPWPNAINLGGYGAGMEYPGIVFDGWSDRDPELFWITTHELGHGWFPMIVGTDERRRAWMDEGFNTFIDAYASDHFNHGEFAPKRDAEFAPKTGVPADDIVPILTDANAPTLMTPADLVSERYRHSVTYFKSAYGLKLLREQILGPDRFDAAFRRYIAVWAFKHPGPSDFFRIMESEGGEDLSWFWRGWYFRNWSPNYAIAGTSYVDGDPSHGLVVHVENRGSLPLPVVLRREFSDGTHADTRIPTETWMRQKTATLTFPGGPKVTRVRLDPDHVIPDVDRADNDAEVGVH
jgi:hypothetical protein